MKASPLSTADLLDELRDGAFVLELQFRHFGKCTAFAGPIATARCRGDNALVARALRRDGDGRVLVVDGGGSLRSALVGDRLAAAASANGWAGIVVNGAVRDVSALRQIEIGVYALGTSPRRGSKSGTGSLNIPIRFGGVLFEPGAMLHCDEDGLAIVRDDSSPR